MDLGEPCGRASSQDGPFSNFPPVQTAEDTPAATSLTAQDIDSGVLIFEVTKAPQHGVLGGSSSNLTYAPDLDFNGSGTFTYVANDGTADSNSATVSITVELVNDSPLATWNAPPNSPVLIGDAVSAELLLRIRTWATATPAPGNGVTARP